MLVSGAQTINATNTTWYNNVANGSGGALHTDANAAGVNLNYATVLENRASSGAGGGINVIEGALNLNRSLITGNIAPTQQATNNMSLAQTIADGGLNLYGFNGVSGVTATTSLVSLTPTAVQAPLLSSLVEPGLSVRNGDGYVSQLKRAAIAGSGIARDYIDAADCGSVDTDARGENRPDDRGGKCDVGAYEFTVLNCQEDAQRRYAQGDSFVKSCAENLEDFELGVGRMNFYMLITMLALLGVRFKALKPRF
jgi:hypothetical protein